jgi:hypothetical protein
MATTPTADGRISTSSGAIGRKDVRERHRGRGPTPGRFYGANMKLTTKPMTPKQARNLYELAVVLAIAAVAAIPMIVFVGLMFGR